MVLVKSYVVLILSVLVSVVSKCTANNPPYRTEEKCLPGSNHKLAPSPEGPEYAACHQYRPKSCCTANFTKQLAKATVTNIDTFYWNRCGNLTKRCEEFMIAVECFYRCSPNILHWQGTFPSSLDRVPVCHQFCDDWFDACKDEKTCATDWLADYNRTSDGTNHCRSDSMCLTFKERYQTAEGMCNKMWGVSFNYTTDINSCLLINGTDLVSKNEQAAKSILGSTASTTASNIASSTALIPGVITALLISML